MRDDGLCCLVVCVALLATFCSAFVHVDPSNGLFVDDTGRTRLFRAVNVVYKVDPFYPDLEKFDPELSLTEGDMKNLHDWGFTAVRLHVAWEGLEPQPGMYNETYLNVLERIVNTLAKYDLMVILDAHQDLMSKLFCGEGFPDWAVLYDEAKQLPFPEPLHPKFPKIGKYPDPKYCFKYPFWEYYFAEVACISWQNFYDNSKNLLEKFGDFWVRIASRFASNPNVLGYEILNEPWVGDIYFHPKLLEGGEADRIHLIPTYDYIQRRIRLVDQRHILFFEPSVIMTQFVRSGFGSINPVGGESMRNLSAFAFHIYCPDFNASGDPKSRLLCDIFDLEAFGIREADRKSMKVAGFVTEFGDVDNNESGAEELSTIADLADNHLLSTSYWQFKSYNDPTTQSHYGNDTLEGFYFKDGRLQERKVKALSRTYATRICGTPTKVHFDDSTSQFVFEFDVSLRCGSQPTEIFLSEALYYAKGFNVSIDPPNVACYAKQKNGVFVYPNVVAKEGDHVKVTITKA